MNAPANPPDEAGVADADDTPDTPTRFDSFDLAPALLSALEALGFESPTPIQESAIPAVLEGRDVIGRARTGSGKTAAFGLPILHRILTSDEDASSGVQALILAPTRELALQVSEAMQNYAQHARRLSIATVYGGAGYGPQIRAIRQGAQVVVGTPGRVSDLVEKGVLDLSSVRMFALDEADEMLRMGFIDEVEALLAGTPPGRQVVLFSATMPPPIRRVAEKHLQSPAEIQVESQAMSTGHITQRWIQVHGPHKPAALTRVLLAVPREATLIFTRTRDGASNLADALGAAGFNVATLHGGLNQTAREQVLGQLRDARLAVLVATDVAARGIDVDHITHVINYELPESAEQYVHRIGRTGRAGRDGVAITLVTPYERRRFLKMRGHARAQIDQVSVPSIELIQTRRQKRLMSALGDAAEGDLARPSEVLATLLEQGMDAEGVALAALALLSEQNDIAIPPDPAPAPQRSRRNRGSRDRDSRPPRRSRGGGDPCNAVELFLAVGRRRGVRPGDLVGALTNEAGITSDQIGRINIDERKSFVGLSAPAAEQVLSRLKTIQIRGKNVRIDRSQ